MDDEFQYKFELLKQEMDNLQNGIRNYDGTLFTIKGWAITVFSAFIIFAFDKTKPEFFAFCTLAVFLFWLLDAIYKSIQRVSIHRYNQIEQFLRSPDFGQAVKERSFKDFVIPNTGPSFDVKPVQKYKDIVRSGFMLHNFLLYAAMLIIIAVIAVVYI